MIKTLTAVGNSLGLIIDKPILELLDIDKDTRLEIKTDGEGLIIRPVRAAGAAAEPPPRASDRALEKDLSELLSAEDLPELSSAEELPELEDLAEAPAAAAAPPPPAPAPPAVAPPPPAPAGPPVLPAVAAPPAPPAAPKGEAKKPEAPQPEAKKPAAKDPSERRPVAAAAVAAPEVVVELRGAEVARVALGDREIILGRDPAADLPLDDRALSRKHVKIERRGAAIWVSDLGSANGTYVNGEKVIEPRRLHGGDVIGVGHYKVHVAGVEVASDRMPVLTLRGPEGTHRFALVGEQIVIGRSQSCDISIGHKSISRRHVRIAAETEGFLVEDLGSQNGCKLNGAQLKGSAPFVAGDRIEICDFSLELGFLDDEDAAEAAAEKGYNKRPSTMLIDKSAMAQAAYVDGDFGNVKSKHADAAPNGKGKADTGEFDLASAGPQAAAKKPKAARSRRR